MPDPIDYGFDVPSEPIGAEWVYILLGAERQALYVGRTTHPRWRMSAHRREKGWFSEVKFAVWRFAGFDRRECERVESRLIIRLCPAHNVAGVIEEE